MRTFIIALGLGVAATALLPMHNANAWWDGYGRWHPNFIRPPVVVAPPPPYYAVPRPYAHWVPQHRDYWGRFIPGHWA